MAGALAIAVTVLAGVVVYLFKLYANVNAAIGKAREDNSAATAAMNEERRTWKEREAKLEESVEKRVTAARVELSEKYAKELTEQVRLARENDTNARREFAGIIEGMTDRQSEVLGKLADRITAVGRNGNS